MPTPELDSPPMAGLGNWLPERIVKAKLRNKVDLARKSGVSTKTLDRMQKGLHMPQIPTLRALEPFLKAKAEDIERIYLGEIEDTPMLPDAEPGPGNAPASGLIRIGEIPMRRVPLHRDLFASRFRQQPQPEGDSLMLPVQADFAAIVTGDCMSPDYPSGCMVAFSYAVVDPQRPEVGRAYYVEKKDGELTFKRLTEVGTKTLIFECINPDMPDRKPIVVLKDKVERMARAVWMGRTM